MTPFAETSSYSKILDFIEQIMNSIRNETQSTNPNMKNLIDGLRLILNDTSPVKEPQRFGNVAFRVFHKKVHSGIVKLLKKNNISHLADTNYLTESFGNPTRLDYGTGHELNFICYLYVLRSVKQISINEVRNILDTYFELVRAVINKYNLEPAGSHGVWGIDDYQLMPFLLGSVELIDNPIGFDDLLKSRNEYIYGKALKFVEFQKCKHRHVPFEMHSPILYEYRLRGWPAVNHELFIRYKNDVLESKAVNQHFIFSEHLTNN